jgi:hypothetical protein
VRVWLLSVWAVAVADYAVFVCRGWLLYRFIYGYALPSSFMIVDLALQWLTCLLSPFAGPPGVDDAGELVPPEPEAAAAAARAVPLAGAHRAHLSPVRANVLQLCCAVRCWCCNCSVIDLPPRVVLRLFVLIHIGQYTHRD